MNFNIGSVIKKIRHSKNITQARLAEGSCSIKQLSRIESNQSIPSTLLLQEFSLKLGEDLSMYFHYLDQPDPVKCYLNVVELENHTNTYNYEDVLLKSTDILKHLKPDSSYYYLQMTYYNENSAIHTKKIDHSRVDRLKYALSLSLGISIDLKGMFDGILNSLQYKIISLLILTHLENKEYSEAENLLVSSIESFETFYPKITDTTYPRMIYNLARLQYVKDDYESAAETSLKGIEHCKESNQLSHLAYLSLVRGKSLHKLGLIEEGLKFINLFVYLSDISTNHKDKDHIINNVKLKHNL